MATPVRAEEVVKRKPSDVRFGSKGDICAAKSDVRFTSNTDRESGFPPEVTSALRPIADRCSTTRDVRYGPIADMGF